jgi:ubiquinone biosynthesis protein
VQPQLVLLQKTLLTIEGVGRQLYPDLDLWKTAKPVLEDWMRQRQNPVNRLKELMAAWPEINEDLSLLPRLIHRAIRRAETADTLAAKHGPAVVPVRRGRGDRLFAGAAILIAGVLWAGLAEPVWIGWIGALAGLVLMFSARPRA